MPSESFKSSDSGVSVEAEQLSKLVCPVCYEYMKPPIMQCEKGHGICEQCDDLLSQCPICKSLLTHRRSSNLEILTTLVLFPCKTCKEKLSLDELTVHRCSAVAEEPDILCFLGQIYGKCPWRGLAKDMIDHISEQHPNNYWTKQENLAKWNYYHLSSIGIQQVYILDLTEAIFVFVQKFDSNSQSLVWNASCESEKDAIQFFYEIQLYSDYTTDTLRCRNVIQNEDNIMMSLPNNNEIVIPLSKVAKFLGDNNYVNYKVTIRNVVNLKNNQSDEYYQRFTEITEDNVDSEERITKQSCTQKTCNSVVDFYNYVKKVVGCQ